MFLFLAVNEQIKEILRFLIERERAGDWKQIGEELRFTSKEITTIEENQTLDDNGRLTALFNDHSWTKNEIQNLKEVLSKTYESIAEELSDLKGNHYNNNK